jgi:alkane 1-monooxygenase
MEEKSRLGLRHAIPFLVGYSLIPIYLFAPTPWAVPLFIFVAIPLFDLILGKSTRNFLSDHIPAAFDLLVWLWPLVQVLNLSFALYRIASGEITGPAILSHALALGMINGAVGITYAHELIHRKSRAEVFLGEIILASVCYLHWRIEHVRGHHAHVATPEDPASAPRGMSVYAFVPRSIAGAWVSVWKLEKARLERKNKGPLAADSYLWPSLLVPGALAAAIGFGLGAAAMAAFLLQALVAVVLLEIVNYIEHYGLERTRLPSGNYERPHPGISWNADNRLTNAFLINLQRHSDHHARPRVPYPLLESRDEAPQLPFGYATMIIMSLVPPLYKRVVEPRISPAGDSEPA